MRDPWKSFGALEDDETYVVLASSIGALGVGWALLTLSQVTLASSTSVPPDSPRRGRGQVKEGLAYRVPNAATQRAGRTAVRAAV